MNTYDKFKFDLMIENFSDSEFDEFCESLDEDDIDFLEAVIYKKDSGGGGSKRQSSLKNLKTRKSDGSGGTVTHDASARHKSKKRNILGWKTNPNRRSTGAKRKVQRIGRKTKRRGKGKAR